MYIFGKQRFLLEYMYYKMVFDLLTIKRKIDCVTVDARGKVE